MKIFYVNVIEQNAGWGAECFVNRGFNIIGHETATLDFRVHRNELYRSFLGISDFDSFFLQRGDGFPLSLIKAVRRPRFFWASELVSRCRDQDRLLNSGLFDHVFVHTKACERAVINRGWMPSEQVTTLINGFDERIHHPISAMEKDIDILFIGSMLPRRRKILDELQQDFIIAEYSAFGDQMVTLLNRAKIVLNIHAENYLDTETRIFEALGCGAFVITEKLSEESPFISGEHLREVSDVAEMKQAIRYYLYHEEARKIIADNGYHEAAANHTYVARAKQIAAIMGRYVSRYSNNTPAIDDGRLKQYGRIEPLLNKTRHYEKVYQFIDRVCS